MPEYERLYRREPLPDHDEIKDFMGKRVTALYEKIESFIDDNYPGHVKEIYFGGKNFGVMVRWRRSGKTLCSIFPEKKGFSVVLVYGKREREAFVEASEEFSPHMRELYDNTREYHDGRWLLIRIEDSLHIDEVISMIKIKKKPETKKG